MKGERGREYNDNGHTQTQRKLKRRKEIAPCHILCHDISKE